MRLTRAALRAQVSEEALKAEIDVQLRKQDAHDPTNDIFIHEDSDRENSALTENEEKSLSGDRIVFKDITAENYPALEAMDTAADEESELKKPRKGRAKTKNQKRDQAAEAEHKLEAMADPANEEITSFTDQPPVDAIEDNADTTSTEGLEETSVAAIDITGTSDTLPQNNEFAKKDRLGETQDESSRSIIVTEIVAKTPKFDPELHASSEQHHPISNESPEDSFVDTIKTRSPSKHAISQQEKKESMSAESISQTPARSVSSPRVEDSVAALDALEEAIEKFAEDLPSLDAMTIESPTKSRKISLTAPAKVQAKTPAKITAKVISPAKSKTATTHKKPKPLAEKLADAKRTTVKDRVQAIESKPSVSAHRRATSVIVTKSTSTMAKSVTKPGHSASKSVSTISSKPMVSFSNSPVKDQPNFMKKRVTSGPLSTSKPGFVPAKSVKPITKANFVLPGEAIAAKLKAQREERVKREEDATDKKNLRAKPLPSKTSRPSVVPRATKTSLARLSIMQKSGGEDKENVAPPRPTTTKVTPGVAKKREDATKVSSDSRTSPAAAISKNVVRKSTSTSLRIVSASSITSTTSQPAAAKPVIKGKDVYSRTRQVALDQQREKKEKEEAAKKARAEAAEKGRQASREWAEKQKRKTMALSDAKAKIRGEALAT